MITSIVTGFLVTAAGLYFYDKIRTVPIKNKPREESWVDFEIARMKVRDEMMNDIYDRQYESRIKSAAEDDYMWWLHRKPFDIMKPMRMGSIITVSTNHFEKFPKRFEEYVKEEFEKIKFERHTTEEIKQIEYNKKKAFYDAMHIEMPEEESI